MNRSDRNTSRALSRLAASARWKLRTALVQAVNHGAPPPVQTHEAIAVIAVIEAGFASSTQGRAVVPDLTAAERAAWTQ